MKNKIRNLIIAWLFKKPIRKYVHDKIKGRDKDFIAYHLDLLRRDESRMIGSKEGLQGHYDFDIQMNRQLQAEIKNYA